MKRSLLLIGYMLLQQFTVQAQTHHSVVGRGYASACHEWNEGCFTDYEEAKRKSYADANRQCFALGFGKAKLIGKLECQSRSFGNLGHTNCQGTFECQ